MQTISWLAGLFSLWEWLAIVVTFAIFAVHKRLGRPILLSAILGSGYLVIAIGLFLVTGRSFVENPRGVFNGFLSLVVAMLFFAIRDETGK